MRRFFLSAVTGEFGPHREGIAADLLRAEVEVREQQYFRNQGGTLLQLLEDYIRKCDAVIHLIGAKSGWEAKSQETAGEVQQFLHDNPGFLEKFPQLAHLVHQLSYTQWEAWLALYHHKPLHIWVQQSTPPIEFDAVQAEHFKLIQNLGRLWPSFTSEEHLRREVLIALNDLLPPQSRIKPICPEFTTIGSLFKGREGFLEQLRKVLVEKPTHVAAVTARQAIHGLGGVGKTRVAVEYGLRFQHEYTALLYVTADSPQNLEQNLAKLCGALVLNLPEQTEPIFEKQVAAAVRWLREHAGWFLVLDNVDTPAAQAAVQQRLGQLSGGHVVITSRLSDWEVGVEPLELDVLAAEDAVALLMERTGSKRRAAPTDAADVFALAKDLDGLALALEQAGAFIVKHPQNTFADYRQRWREQEQKVLAWDQNLNYPRSVATTWQTSVNELGPHGRRLLNVLCWLAPDVIPLAMLQELELDADFDLEAALADLTTYSLAHWRNDYTAIQVHRIVEEMTRYRLPLDQRPTTFQPALEMVDAYFPSGDRTPQDVRNWPQCQQARLHALSVTDQAPEFGNPTPTAVLLNQLGLYLKSRAEYQEAEPLYRRALAINEAAYGPDHPTVSKALNNLAQLLQATNRLQEAEPLMRRVVQIFEKSYGVDHPNVATALNNLAQFLQDTNRLEEAEPLMRRALAIDEAANGPDHPKVAIRLNNLAQLLQATNRLQEAEPLMRRALDIDEAAYGPDHPKVARDLNNLAQLLQATNRLEEAEPLMRRALAIDEAAYGPDHPDVARDLNNLAQLLQDTNRLQEAEPLMRRALEIDEAAYGPDHPAVAIDLNNLATLLQATSRLEEAEPLLRRALDIDEAAYGPDHPDVAIDLNNLAQLLKATNRLQEAEPLMRRALEIFRDSLGDEHPNTIIVLHNYDRLLDEMKE